MIEKESGKEERDTDRLKREGGRRRTRMIRSTEVVKKECTKSGPKRGQKCSV